MKTLTSIVIALLINSAHAYVSVTPFDDFIEGGLSGGTEGPYSLFADADQKRMRTDHDWSIHQGKKELIITIDDGPTRGVTDKILDTLRKHNVQATFFVVASRLKGNEDLFQRMLDEGHIVANHTMTHPNLKEVGTFNPFRGNLNPKKKLREELIGAHEAIAQYMDNSDRFYFRAPGGVWTTKAAEVINESAYGSQYFGPVAWDIGGSMNGGGLFGKTTNAADWACWSSNYRWSVRRCLRGYIHETEQKRGGVVLFHDLNTKSADLIEGYIKEFSDRPDYRFVSLDEAEL